MASQTDLPLGRILAHISRLQATRVDQLMEQIGLYRGQALLLWTLSERDGLTHSEMAEKLQISPAAITKVIQRLEKLHYLQRRPDLCDERVSRVFLLEEGRAMITQIHAVFQKINQIIVTDLSSDEQENLRELLARVHANLQDIPFDSLNTPGSQA